MPIRYPLNGLRHSHGGIMNHYQRANYALAIAFARGILDGEQLAELLAIYKGEK